MKTLLALLAGVVMTLPPSMASAEPSSSVAYDFEFESIEGGAMPLAQHRGKALLVVNTASFCGFTRQYEGLQTLWERYKNRDLIVIGVPSNDFGGQEPKNEAEILGYCKGAFGVSFPLTTKQVVSGANAHPFYNWARNTLGDAATPRWNFHKYLVGRDGKLIASFESNVEPLSDKLVGAIETALAGR